MVCAGTCLSPEDPESSKEDEQCRAAGLQEERLGDDRICGLAGRLHDDMVVHWLHPQTGRGGGGERRN